MTEPPPDSITRAVSWAAVSSKPQADRESLDDQHRLNHALADALGWRIVCDITVPGESRSYYRLSDARQAIDAYGQLTALAVASAVDWVICKSRDRLARTRRLNREVADFLQDHEVRVYSRTMPPGSLEQRTEAEVWGEAIEAGYSEAEILRLRQRREMGMQARVRHGKLPAKLPWGFSYVHIPGEKEPQVRFTDPVAEATVRFVVDSFLKGLTISRITAEAETTHGLSTPRGGRWSVTTVHYILDQPAYFGLCAFGRRRQFVEDGRIKRKLVPVQDWIVAEGSFPAPYTPGDWHRVLAEKERRAQEHPRSRPGQYPLSGLAWCVACDKPMVGAVTRTRHYYRCQVLTHERHRPHKKHYVRTHVLHRQLGEYLDELASDPDGLQRIVEKTVQSTQVDWTGRLTALLRQQDNFARRRQRWGDAYEAGAITLHDFAERLEMLEEREERTARNIQRAQAELNQVQGREEIAELVRVGANQLPQMLLADADPEAREMVRALCTRLFQRILVADKTVVGIDFNWPQPL